MSTDATPDTRAHALYLETVRLYDGAPPPSMYPTCEGPTCYNGCAAIQRALATIEASLVEARRVGDVATRAADEARAERDKLKADLEAVMRERDALKWRIEGLEK